VNAITSLRTHPTAKDRCIALANDSNGHVSLAAITAYDFITRNERHFSDSTSIIRLIQSDRVTPLVREEARKIAAKKLGERAFPHIGEWRSDHPFISAQRIKAYGNILSDKSVILLQNVLRQSVPSIVTIAAIEAYLNIARQSNVNEQEKFLSVIVSLPDKNDAGISYSVAVSFQDTAFAVTLRKKFLPALVRSYRGMDASTDLEPMIELQNVFALLADSVALPAVHKGAEEADKAIRTAARHAYTAITGKEHGNSAEEIDRLYRPFYRSDDLALLDKFSGARVRTTQGSFTIRFEKDCAPLTVLNFILLVRKGFYDGLYFHRVVGNFVIQGGDPLGNGSGGPHYAIRTEVHPNARYSAGAVGMASAGKDTEGSQWFVTHVPTPHLEYRYTVFGYTDDRDIVDRIMIGDRIETIELF
jgi:cyclophilin family peptidyl-prolyl cis-trans isomerase